MWGTRFFPLLVQRLSPVGIQRMNQWYLGGNLGGWAIEDSLCVLSGFPLLWDKIYEYREVCRERNPRRLSLAYLDFFSQCSLILPVRGKWVTLTRMWLTAVTDTAVRNWPVVTLGIREMEWKVGDCTSSELSLNLSVFGWLFNPAL